MKLLPVVVAAIVGIALMFLLGFALVPIIPSDITLEGMLAMTLGIGGFCYFATGLIAGAWANWRGATHGLFAAMLVWIGNLIYSFVTGIAYEPASREHGFVVGIFIVGVFAMGVGALGGFVGDRIRH